METGTPETRAQLAEAARRLLATGGRFVFSVDPLAFNSDATRLCAELATRDDRDEGALHAVKIASSLTMPPGTGTGMLGEPEHHWCVHRPLHALFGVFFRAGCVLDGLEEPACVASDTRERIRSWSNVPGLPPVLAARFVPRGGA